MEDETRQCTKCKLEKPIKDFQGKWKRCKRCCADMARTPQRRNAPSLRKQWGEQMFKILRIDPKDY